MRDELALRTRLAATALAVGDAATIVLFVVVGLTNHDEGITLAGIARTALPILGAWFAVAPFAKTYTRPGLRTLLVTWVVAVLVGVAIRAIALHRSADGSQVAFGIVAMIATLFFLFAWRGAAMLATRALRSRATTRGL